MPSDHATIAQPLMENEPATPSDNPDETVQKEQNTLFANIVEIFFNTFWGFSELFVSTGIISPNVAQIL